LTVTDSVRGEWVWSYPDPDDEKREGMSDSGGGSEADEAAFSLTMNDEVRFRVRTLEFTEVRHGAVMR